jgi:type II secretory pathway component HofQ
LPTGGPTLELDYKDTDVRGVLDVLATVHKVNLVMPDHLRGQVTIIAKGLPWSDAVEGVLASQGLWYRYRPEGRILRIAPRKELDHEDEEKAEAAGR